MKWAGTVLSVGLGLFWATTAMAKAHRLVAYTLGGGDVQDLTYVDELPPEPVIVAVAAEMLCAFFLLSGRARKGHLLGIGMLLVFSLLLHVMPPRPGQACGCAGALTTMLTSVDVNPLARNVFLLGPHAVGLVVVGDGFMFFGQPEDKKGQGVIKPVE